jgi:SAM-dependent methyltransferase
VDRLAPNAGERALDIGCGRGAVTFRVAERVGTSGHVDAIDLAPGMVRLTGAEARERGLAHVDVQLGDAGDPQLEPGSYDLVASSLVLFFLPDPGAAVRRWLPLLTPGGRLGIATFRPVSGTWRAIIDVFDEYDAARRSTPQTPGTPPDVFDTDAGVEQLLTSAGACGVRTESATYPIPFEDADQWRRWTLVSPMRGLWRRAPEEAHPEILGRVRELLDATRQDGGPARVDVEVRYTLGTS